MKTSRNMAAYIAAKKTQAAKDNQASPYHKGDLVISQFNKYPNRDITGIERGRIYKRSCKGTRSISSALAAVYGIH